LLPYSTPSFLALQYLQCYKIILYNKHKSECLFKLVHVAGSEVHAKLFIYATTLGHLRLKNKLTNKNECKVYLFYIYGSYTHC
jgi:hypothetical protein